MQNFREFDEKFLKYLNCKHNWEYGEIIRSVQGLLEQNRQCKICGFKEKEFGTTPKDIKDKFGSYKSM